jgi:steroid 5-alpha reductase family enzyme
VQVSGIPLLEQKYDRVYKNDAAYQHYKATTPLLLPKPLGRP